MQNRIYTGSVTPLCLRLVPKQPAWEFHYLCKLFTSTEPHKDFPSFVFIFPLQ